MIRYLTLLLLVSPVTVNGKCDKVVPGYEKKSTMYVVCKQLKISSNVAATKLVKKLLGQYKGEPDELTIHFVTSRSAVGKTDPGPNEQSAYYYTHSSELVLWPKLRAKTRKFKVKR